MQRFGIGDQGLRFARLLWEREGIESGEVVTLCREELGWAKSTTYTMLRKLCERGLFQNVNSIVVPVMSEEQYLATVGMELLQDKFGGSLQQFINVMNKYYGTSEEKTE